MKYITYKGKQYPILELCIQNGQYIRIAHEKLLDELGIENNDLADEDAIAIDESIYFYVPGGFDFSKVQAGETIMLDEEFIVLDVISAKNMVKGIPVEYALSKTKVIEDEYDAEHGKPVRKKFGIGGKK